jgi:PKD repeat protein
MKIGKIVILAILVCNLLVLTGSAAAIEENETLTDQPNDVYSIGGMLYYSEDGQEEFNFITEHDDIEVDNIDIREVTYQRNDKDVTMTLKVEGIIEDRGNIEDLNFESELGVNTVAYNIQLSTSYETYMITYVNGICTIANTSDYKEVNLSDSDFSVENGVLTVSFELKTSNETYVELSGGTSFTKFDFDLYSDLDNIDNIDEIFIYLVDTAPDLPLMVNAYAPSTAEVGLAVEFEGLPSFGQQPYEFLWDFGDGTTSKEQNPSHIYDEPGIYEYNFTVTDNSNTSESFTYDIEILEGDTTDTPGFEFIIAIMAIGFIFLWKRKR